MDFTTETIFYNSYKRMITKEFQLLNNDKVTSSSIFYPTGICMVGKTKTFVDTDGVFYPCEKVNETRDEFIIGDYRTGHNIKNVQRLLNFTTSFGDRCRNCYAIRDCSLCLDHFGATGLCNSKKTENICEKNRMNFLDSLKKKIVLQNIVDSI